MKQIPYERMIDAMDFNGMSGFISSMLKQPIIKTDDKLERFADIPSGRYALPGDDSDICFYQLMDADSDGNRRFYRLSGAPGEFRRQRVYRSYKILAEIQEDIEGSFALFGQTVGVCGKCGSPLTQTHTRERGIGDICYAKLKG